MKGNNGIGYIGLAQAITIILKLLNVTKISWWQVFIPTYFYVGTMLFCFAVVIYSMIKAKNKK